MTLFWDTMDVAGDRVIPRTAQSTCSAALYILRENHFDNMSATGLLHQRRSQATDKLYSERTVQNRDIVRVCGAPERRDQGWEVNSELAQSWRLHHTVYRRSPDGAAANQADDAGLPVRGSFLHLPVLSHARREYAQQESYVEGLTRAR